MAHVRPSSRVHAWLPWLVIVVLTIALPRLLLLRSPPATDEGYMAYFAMKAYLLLEGSGQLPGDGPLMLYPILLSWINGLQAESLPMLRLADLIIASVAGLLLLAMIARESGSRWWGPLLLGAPFLLGMNHTEFIQYGFKNSYQAAFIPLFAAVLLWQRADSASFHRWLLMGVLIAFGVLLRETLAPFAVLAVAAAWISHGRRQALAMCAGGAALALPLLALDIALRGDLTSLLDAYRGSGAVYSAQPQTMELFLLAARRSVAAAPIACALSIVATVVLLAMIVARRDHWLLRRSLFWFACALLPLVEPATKAGFPYHFAVMLPAMAMLCALAWRTLLPAGAKRTRLAIGVLAIGEALLLVPPVLTQAKESPQAVAEVQQLVQHGWPADQIEQSNYLLAARMLRDAAPPGASASISGFMFSVYPLSGRLPPSGELNNLSARIIQLDLDPARLAKELATCSPDLVLTTTRTDWPGAHELEQAIEMSSLYEQIGVLPADPAKHYGIFGGTLYRRIKPGGHHCAQ